MFQGGIEAADIKQGGLGNCYFLSSLAALTENPQRIRDLFLNHSINTNGVTGVKLCKNGIKQCVFVDDCIPTKNGRPAFTRTNGHETWVIMIEKAWAKIHGSYERIVGGDPCNTIRDLCGAPGDSYEIKKTEGLWEIIQKADNLDHIIQCSIDNQSEEQAAIFKELGLVDGHAYTMISVKDIDYLRLCLIRNPWGNFEWKGDYSDDSDLWTDELKEAVGYKNEDDGCFWMKWDDVQYYFSRVSVNRINDDHTFVSKPCHHE